MAHDFERVAKSLRETQRAVAFTGAGISVESGIPSFRGPEGLWTKYDPSLLELRRFLDDPLAGWRLVREIFYDFFGQADPNDGHRVLAQLEQAGLLQAVITQNIDNLHQEAGSKVVHEYHGTAQRLLCLECGETKPTASASLEKLPPLCSCGGLLKPDFIFFGEAIPEAAARASLEAARHCAVMLVIGTSGEVMPACQLPYVAKEAGALIVEISPERTAFTRAITDVFLQGPASEMLRGLWDALAL